jgi:hypothetical protein
MLRVVSNMDCVRAYLAEIDKSDDFGSVAAASVSWSSPLTQ